MNDLTYRGAAVTVARGASAGQSGRIVSESARTVTLILSASGDRLTLLKHAGWYNVALKEVR